MGSETEEISFIIVWKIKNWKMQRYYIVTSSPKFIIKTFLNTTWLLNFRLLSFDSRQVLCTIERDKNSEGPDEITIDYSFSVSNNLLVLSKDKKRETYTFKTGSTHDDCEFFVKFNQECFPYDDNLYIVCNMSMNAREIEKQTKNNVDVMIPGFSKFISNSGKCSKPILEKVQEYLQTLQNEKYVPNKCFAQTVVLTDKKIFVWTLKTIIDKRQSKLITSVSDFPDILIDLYKDQENTVQVEIQPCTPIYMRRYLLCRIWIQDLDDNIIWFDEDRYLYLKKDQYVVNQNFKIILENNNENKDQKSKFDINTSYLHLEICISNSETVSWMDNTSLNNFTDLEVAEQNLSTDKFRMKMKDVYTNTRFSDVIIQLPNKKFEAHKDILCANSAVFKAMFEHSMKELGTNIVNISDVDENTMERMLMYMYSDIMESMQQQEYVRLYKAADKYQILSLQKKCAMYLKLSITQENALGTLCLSDAHGDEELKRHASTFIVTHIEEILPFEEWKEFSNNNMSLANTILTKACQNLTGLQINQKLH